MVTKKRSQTSSRDLRKISIVQYQFKSTIAILDSKGEKKYENAYYKPHQTNAARLKGSGETMRALLFSQPFYLCLSVPFI